MNLLFYISLSFQQKKAADSAARTVSLLQLGSVFESHTHTSVYLHWIGGVCMMPRRSDHSEAILCQRR